MLARRLELKRDSRILGETPMLVPAFSSKVTPDIGTIIREMREHITGPILISAYDIFYRDTTKIQLPITYGTLIFLDSGGYETQQDADLADIVHEDYKPKKWSKKDYLSVLKDWPYKRPTVIVSYDHPRKRYPVNKQIEIAKSTFKALKDKKDVLTEILLKPEARNQLLAVESVIENIEALREFDIIGFTEKELGSNTLLRMENIARIRLAMDENGVRKPLHIFGSLDMVATPLYFVSGTDIFDALTWLRYGFVNGLALYEQNYGIIKWPLDYSDKLIRVHRIVGNLAPLATLRQQMSNYLVDGKLAHFTHHQKKIKEGFDALRARLKGRGKEV